MYNIIYIISIVIACYFTKVEIVNVNERDPDGAPINWMVYFRNPENQRLYRSVTFWPYYDVGDNLKICGSDMPWGEWYFTHLPLIVR